ncbi:MAG TPA: MBL fold metallo-hydrolase [Acidobacteriota bacterium]|nr:MBL fold metallo-hydrolase [Acidobacteriota bacterium]
MSRTGRHGAIGGLLILTFLGTLLGQKMKPGDEAWEKFQAAGPDFSRGLKAFQAGRHDDAAEAFEKSVRTMPRHAFALYYLSNLAYIRGDYAAALPLMERSLAAFDLIQELYENAGRLERCKTDAYRQLVDREWENIRTCLEARELEVLGDQINDDQSRRDLRAQGEREALVRQKAHYTYFLGNILFQLERFPEARRRYGEAIALDPRHADAHNNLAAVLYMAGEHQAAFDCLESAEKNGLEAGINLKLKQLVYEALGRPAAGILEEDLSGPGPDGLGVMRFALAFKDGRSERPPLYVNAYVVHSPRTKAAVIVDPGVEDPRLGEYVKKNGLDVKAILITHGHGDHARASGVCAAIFGAPVWAGRADAGLFEKAPDRWLEKGETLAFDGFTGRVLAAPGHTSGSLCFLIGDRLFSGDTLFKGGIGRTGETDTARALKIRERLVRTIKQGLLALPGATLVCPGHGGTTTIAAEAKDNPFLKT